MWTPDVTLKAGDRLPVLTTTLRDGDGNAIDLTGYAAVRFIMASGIAVTPSINSTVSGSSTAGVAVYAWSTADASLTADHYFWEFKLLDGTGRWLTVPNGGYGTAELVTALSTA